MNWGRKAFVNFLALLLLISLVGAAEATSANIAFGKPDKIKTWLSQSKIYDHFVDNAIEQGKKSAGDLTGSESISLSDSAVEQAAKTAFSQQLLEHNVDTFLDSNYAWLSGKTDKPAFVIDLTDAKAGFAQQVADYVQTRFASLPVCTDTQLAELAQAGTTTNFDPLSISCRPASISPATEAATVQEQISTSGDFLSNPVITPTSINPSQSGDSQPYYEKFSKAPQLYQIGTKLPIILAVAALIFLLGVIFVTIPRRKGLRKVSFAFAIAGILLVGTKFVSDAVFKAAEKKVFNSDNNGQLQQSLTDFAHRAESQLTTIDLYFGIAFLVIAIIGFIALVASRNRGGKTTNAELQTTTPQKQPSREPEHIRSDDDYEVSANDTPRPAKPIPARLTRPREQQPSMDIRGPKQQQSVQPPTLRPIKKAAAPRKRLIQ